MLRAALSRAPPLRVLLPKPRALSSAPPTPPAPSSPALSFAERSPFAFQVSIATLKTSAADLLTQKVAEGRSWADVDWRRNAVFVVFGTAYLGCFQWYIMVTKFRVWFPTMDRFAKLSFAKKLKDRAGMMDAGKMVLFDLFVHMPLM